MKERQYLFVVDDDDSVRTSLATLFESDGYTVESFVSASEFLKRAPNVGPACLVLDVRLPGLDGFALQQELAEQGRMEEIVFITGYGDIPMGIRATKLASDSDAEGTSKAPTNCWSKWTKATSWKPFLH